MISWDNFTGFFRTGIPIEVLVISLLVAFLVATIGMFCKQVADKKNFVLWVLLIEYLFVVMCSTIIFRGEQSFAYAKLELVPFWTYWAVIKHIPGVSIWDIILNVVMFMPLGLLVTLLFPRITWWKMLIVAMVVSIVIETNQYFFEKGISQIDDVMHNSIGAIFGWMFAKGCIRITNKCKSRL